MNNTGESKQEGSYPQDTQDEKTSESDADFEKGIEEVFKGLRGEPPYPPL